MKIKQKIGILFICVSMLLSTSITALATDYSEKEYYRETNTEVVLEKDALGTPQEVIDEIVKENPNTLITISNYVDSKPAPTPRLVMGIYITSKKTTATNVVDKDLFVISVAKGSEKSLSTEWKESVSASASHSGAKSALGLNGTLTKKYSKTEKFKGPPENSKYNSREYRVKFYVNKGTYSGYYETDMGRGPKVSGTFVDPVRYAEYSIDKTVK